MNISRIIAYGLYEEELKEDFIFASCFLRRDEDDGQMLDEGEIVPDRHIIFK